MSLLAELAVLNTEMESITGDLISSGANIRLAPGRTIMHVEDLVTYMDIPEDALRLIRFGSRTQNDMRVISAGFGVVGETLGVMIEDVPTPIGPYKSANGVVWREWVHPMNTEFMKPNDAAVDELHDFLVSKGWVNAERTVRPGQIVQERSAEIQYDLVPCNEPIPNKFRDGIIIETANIRPAKRDAAMLTSYETAQKTKVKRAGFTSFVDALAANVRTVALANALPADTENRQDHISQANSQLSLLTGTDTPALRDRLELEHPTNDPGGRYSIRPTIGGIKIKDGLDVNFFPDRDVVVTPIVNTEDVAEMAAATGDNEPFGSE